ncbi:MAG: glycerophosphoryl diester phosphodiesterase membrane domain-containing protein [Leptospiraceae bacterium]|nr:glycerophosphoryl diester phosphodiesterase membrane domain-containing protein [Leptospiraceae bacterium]MCB1303523.1 glycerophosphoryl diester phosphodiesterase membrane domain-containing protein [Leptospiraceae bacterium]
MAEHQNPYQVSRATLDTSLIQEGVEFSLGKAISTGFRAFFGSFFVSSISAFVWYIMVTCAYLLFCLAFPIFPHLFAGMMSYGSSAVKGKGRLEDLFRPFNEFGGVFVAGLLYSLFFVAAGLILMTIYGIASAVMAVSLGAAVESINAGKDLFAGMSEDDIFLFVFFGAFAVFGLGANYLLGRLQLVYPLIYELGLGAWESFGASWRITRGKGISLFFTRLLMYLIPGLVVMIPYMGGLFLFVGMGAILDPGGAAEAAVAPMILIYLLIMFIAMPVAYGLQFCFEGAVIELFLTESVKQQISPNYEERNKRGTYVSPGTTPQGPSDAFGPATGSPSTDSPAPGGDQPSTASDSGDTSAPSDPDRFGPPSQPSSDDSGRFPRSGENKDPYNPYN